MLRKLNTNARLGHLNNKPQVGAYNNPRIVAVSFVRIRSHFRRLQKLENVSDSPSADGDEIRLQRRAIFWRPYKLWTPFLEAEQSGSAIDGVPSLVYESSKAGMFTHLVIGRGTRNVDVKHDLFSVDTRWCGINLYADHCWRNKKKLVHNRPLYTCPYRSTYIGIQTMEDYEFTFRVKYFV